MFIIFSITRVLKLLQKTIVLFNEDLSLLNNQKTS